MIIDEAAIPAISKPAGAFSAPMPMRFAQFSLELPRISQTELAGLPAPLHPAGGLPAAGAKRVRRVGSLD